MYIKHYHMILSLVMGILIPLSISYTSNLIFHNYEWIHVPFHTFIEGLGAFTAGVLVIIIQLLKSYNRLSPKYIWIANSLAAMCVMDAFHACMYVGNNFVWTHCITMFTGGTLFACIWLPEKINSNPIVKKADFISLLIAFFVCIVSVIYPEIVPQMVINNHFTLTSKFLNIAGGIGFIASWYYFISQKSDTNKKEHLIFANHSLLFGTSALLFEFSSLWNFQWWLWHFFRLAAYIIGLSYFFNLYKKDIKESLENENKFHAILDNSKTLIHIKNLEGQYILSNKNYIELLGIKNITGKNDTHLFDKNTAECLMENDRYVRTTHNHMEFEKTIYFNDRCYTYISSKFPLLTTQGDIYATCSISTDITMRKDIETKLTLAKLVFENTNEAIIILDEDFVAIEINPAYTTIMGYEKEAVVGCKHNILTSATYSETLYNDMWKTIKKTGWWSGETREKRKDGKLFPKWLTINCVYNNHGDITHYACIFSDITKLKDIQAKLHALAYTDPLTGLPNRELFKERLEKHISYSKRHNKTLAIFFHRSRQIQIC